MASRGIKPVRIAFLAGYTLAVCAGVTLMAGCSGSKAQIWTPNGMPQSVAIATHGDTGSWMSPEAKKANLLYISNDGTNEVYVYHYRTRHLVGTLTGFDDPQGECVDVAGNVYITESGRVVEYAHGGKKPIKTLKGSGRDCSVDPTTGNLAVVITTGVSVYKGAQGKPKYYPYSNPSLSVGTLNCAYDDRGNLFVDAEIHESPPSNDSFGELPKGGETLATVWYPERSENYDAEPGGVAWDGQHIAVGDQSNGIVYIYKPPRSSGGQLKLKRSDYVQQFWIAGNTLIGPNYYSTTAMFWDYPSGGKPTRTLRNIGLYNYGATVSLAR